MPRTPQPNEQLVALLEQAASLTAEAARAAAAGDLEQMAALEADSARLRRDAQRLSSSTQRPRASREAGALISARTHAITSLSEMDVPAPPREIAAYHDARFEQPLDVRALASIRRDERKAWERSRGAHPVYLAPALETRFFRPVRGPLTLSSWPMERRLIGPSSARVDHLRLAIRIAETAERLAGTAAADPLAKLAWRYAVSIPGAVDPAKPVDPTVIASAARVELQVIAPGDEHERAAAARRALAQLTQEQQLWGMENALALVAEGGAR